MNIDLIKLIINVKNINGTKYESTNFNTLFIED